MTAAAGDATIRLVSDGELTPEAADYLAQLREPSLRFAIEQLERAAGDGRGISPDDERRLVDVIERLRARQ